MPFTSSPSLRVAVVGLGYIGLPTAAVLATSGVTVIGVDVDKETVAAVNAGQVHFVEPDLEIAVAGAVAQGRLSAQFDVPEADAFVLAVPTPFNPDHSADLSYVNSATDAVIPRLRAGSLVILESTSPPGTTRHIADRILSARPDLSLDGSDGRGVLYVAHCPERVLPGRVMVEIVTNDRVVGGLTPIAADHAKGLYQRFCKGHVVTTDATTAELAKLVENSFRDVNIAFANEIASVSERLGVDVWELIDIANRHPRVNILKPGPGVGGHCIAVDPWFIVAAAPEESRLVRTAREVNDARPGQVIDRVVAAASSFPAPRIAAFGIAFKANIDDLRESPARTIVGELARQLPHGSVAVVEPYITSLPAELEALPNVKLTDLDAAIANSDIVLLLVDHTDFSVLDRASFESRGQVVIDTRGIWR